MSSKKYYDALSGGNHLTKTPVKNIAASIRQRLLNKSRSDARPFQELVQYYAMEYKGIRIWFPAKLDTMKLNMHQTSR